MKENTYISTGGGKALEILLALIKNLKKAAFDGRVIKAALLGLLIAGGVAKAGAEEVTGEILWGISDSDPRRGSYQLYYLDTDDDLVADTYFRLLLSDKNNSSRTYATLYSYLKEGRQIVFENEGLNSVVLDNDRLIEIKSNGKTIDLNKLFSLEQIKREFPYLYKKLQRQVGDR